MSKKPEGASPQPPGPSPFIPEHVLDIPTQRLYALSLGLLCQAIKLFDFFQYLLFSDDTQTTSYTRKWMLADFLFCVCLARLRIPRLNYPKSVVILQVLSLCLFDGFLFGGLTVNMGIGGSWTIPPTKGISSQKHVSDNLLSWTNYVPTFGLGALVRYGSGQYDSHLVGHHTVRMSPISTARLNPHSETFCISSAGKSVLIPVLLNNTIPSNLRYTLVPLAYSHSPMEVEKQKAVGKIKQVELSARDLKAIEHSRQEFLQASRLASQPSSEDDDFDEYDDDDEVSPGGSSLQKSQTMAYIEIHSTGVLRLDRVLDSGNNAARLIYPSDLTIAPCPTAEFIKDDEVADQEDIRCAPPALAGGAGEELNLSISMYGIPPLRLQWSKEINGKKEHFTVEGIEGGSHPHQKAQDEGRRAASSGYGVPQRLTVPLTVALDAVGTHSYALDTVTDALGNTAHAGSRHHNGLSNKKVLRSTTVLPRPAVSFKGCGPGRDAALKIGEKASLTIPIKGADSLDGPWKVRVKYQPTNDDGSGKESKKRKGWTSMTFTSEENRRDISISANSPGEYVVVGVQGKYCEGDVLSPETCKVVERPRPSAEIEWKKIHECSGDIGVSASLVMHGTPPFKVRYRMQRNDEPSIERIETFTSSKGDFTIQPDRSGHYTFAFTHISDAYYGLVDLGGPSIDQIVHPPASVDFSRTGRRQISSCSGNTVDVDIDLRGTGPWNVDAQVVGGKGSEVIRVEGINTPRKTLQIPIPPAIDRDGGSFEINLLSVEDSYGCKKSVSVPSIVVNVRRVKPTAKFYGSGDKRKITMLEGETANLPLRLTGDGHWTVKYRLAEKPTLVRTATISSPNGEIHVTEKGTYELVGVSDSQCSGSIISESAKYEVNWLSRPSARLSAGIEATFEPHNGSHILAPICEGLPDHVDLELTGRPPFQIMYNVARASDAGGTIILDQPSFSSIQPHTRFQLRTSEPTRVYYEVKQIGDALYPLAKNKQAIIPRSQRLLFEQQVLKRPSALFKTHNRMSYCLNDAFTPRDFFSHDGLIELSGTPPFSLELSIKHLATEVHRETFQINENTWRLDIPAFSFQSIGPHQVTIESVLDASHCEQTVMDPLFKSIWVDIAETAAIVPFEKREHYCVGDVTQFQLEGIPPWTVGYKVNGKSSVKEVKSPRFSYLHQQPGEFIVTSIAHQHKMCKAAVTDLRYVVHSLPSAQVGDGSDRTEDLHEGEQAMVAFKFTGEPPFTFTYQRTELPTKRGAQGKVLETHTVSGIQTNEYTIQSPLEGTWAVTFVQDRYCRYPPAQPEEKGR